MLYLFLFKRKRTGGQIGAPSGCIAKTPTRKLQQSSVGSGEYFIC